MDCKTVGTDSEIGWIQVAAILSFDITFSISVPHGRITYFNMLVGKSPSTVRNEKGIPFDQKLG